ncbi:hypothetical protein LEP1GSC127_1334 [Leptospira kirschneri str. 200801925]|nr:hypothetical protein LEP1GSC122_2233 [Leptospira kirschneri serovar Valbuzzi str. 200702274]EMO75374.1 hypothetical protein LEP1GSC127_1334 [Leptospira kirschneri str. 200801925]
MGTLTNLEITVNTKLWELPLLENSFSFSNALLTLNTY